MDPRGLITRVDGDASRADADEYRPAWETITLVFPSDTLFPPPSSADLSQPRYEHKRHWRRLPDGSLWARYTRAELCFALEVAGAITGVSL